MSALSPGKPTVSAEGAAQDDPLPQIGNAR